MNNSGRGSSPRPPIRGGGAGRTYGEAKQNSGGAKVRRTRANLGRDTPPGEPGANLGANLETQSAPPITRDQIEALRAVASEPGTPPHIRLGIYAAILDAGLADDWTALARLVDAMDADGKAG